MNRIIEKPEYTVRCEMYACENNADVAIANKDADNIGKLYLCNECLCEIAQLANMPPKSPENIIKKGMKSGKRDVI